METAKKSNMSAMLSAVHSRRECRRVRLFGSWEMNWMAYNFGHDVVLPGSTGKPVPFLMYPQAETADGRIDSLDADNFKYEITSAGSPSLNG